MVAVGVDGVTGVNYITIESSGGLLRSHDWSDSDSFWLLACSQLMVLISGFVPLLSVGCSLQEVLWEFGSSL